MVDPVVALAVAVAAAAVSATLLWPRRGLLRRGLSARRASERVRIEDALKHLYDCEYRQHPCTLQSLAGALGISGHQAAALLERLERLHLVASEGGRYRLRSEGRSYALRVIRIHRLWERYLADRTGLDASDWHREAERREHTTTPTEADALAASMGYPRYDPHGDPIPTASGEIAPRRGRPLPDLARGRIAEIVHVEDEPEAVYAQLLAQGLHVGQRVRILESSPARVRFEADQEERILAPALAANIWAVPLEEAEPEVRFARLSALRPGERARVVGISPGLRGPERRRMFDLGIVPGTLVAAEMRSPGGDPTAYRVRGAVIALRRRQAELIQIEPAEGAAR